jgi:hypothetical protein
MASSGKRKRRRLNDLELAAETRVNTREDSANEGTNRDKAFDHSGSTFDSFLEEEGIRGEVEAIALKRVLAWQLEREMQKQHKTKLAMARELHTSRYHSSTGCWTRRTFLFPWTRSRVQPGH